MIILIPQHMPKDVPPSDIYSYSYPKEELFLKIGLNFLTDTYNSFELKTGQNTKKVM